TAGSGPTREQSTSASAGIRAREPECRFVTMAAALRIPITKLWDAHVDSHCSKFGSVPDGHIKSESI
ncbi:MAG: hypothetical protein O7E57_17190, partial [Gammaproteobacteria bacterium]|nr:hypothetical protein [Gammaproteobacteria bacterium]